MKYSLFAAAILSSASLYCATPDAQAQNVEQITAPTTSTINVTCPNNNCKKHKKHSHNAHSGSVSLEPRGAILEKSRPLLISVIGQGVAPVNTASPAQAYALAKRAATADAYRLIAEKVKGVHVEGQDLVQNMMVKRSTIRTSVSAMVRNANVVETTFKEGLCEVEMEITLSHSQFAQ